MLAANSLRSAHPCLDRDCGHHEREHVLTPELAAPGETVVWCVSCQRHETRRGRRWLRGWIVSRELDDPVAGVRLS